MLVSLALCPPKLLYLPLHLRTKSDPPLGSISLSSIMEFFSLKPVQAPYPFHFNWFSSSAIGEAVESVGPPRQSISSGRCACGMVTEALNCVLPVHNGL